MQNVINTITTVEWVILIVAIMALFIAILAWRRAGRALKNHNKIPVTEISHEEKSILQEEQPAVLLDISANKNEFDQVTIVLSNDGRMAAKQVKIIIDKPNNIFDAEGLSGGIESANVTTSSVIMPRLSVLDADNRLPINEILSGNTFELPAALTMSHGKICDYPVSVRWKDENGVSQNKQFTITV